MESVDPQQPNNEERIKLHVRLLNEAETGRLDNLECPKCHHAAVTRPCGVCSAMASISGQRILQLLKEFSGPARGVERRSERQRPQEQAFLFDQASMPF
jgi:hypothetical protein